MPTTVSAFWTNEKVEETVTSAYIHSHLRANEQEVLDRPLYYGEISMTTHTWNEFFGKLKVLDDGIDDEDLPIAEQAVPGLHLSLEPDKALDKRFYKTQFRYLARIIEVGEHIRYADEENVPLISTSIKSVIPSINKDAFDTVRLPDSSERVFVRRRVALDNRMTEKKVLSEIAEAKKFSHQHVISVFGSYLQDGVMSVLSYPAAEYTLKVFLTDTPKAFEAMDKAKRRRILINWPHCLANALAFLHQMGGHHGAIRPSNIHITHQWHISLGSLDGEGILCSSVKSDDLESYQFAPPERWKRAVTIQSTGSARATLPSGSRSTTRTQQDEHESSDPSSRKRSGSSSEGNNAALAAYAFLPASKSQFARFRLSTAADAAAQVPPPPSRAWPTVSGDSISTKSRATTGTSTDRDWASFGRAPSVPSSHSSEGRHRTKGTKPHGIFLAAPESRTAVVQTWKSVQHDSFAADVFSLAAVILEVLTVICKRPVEPLVDIGQPRTGNAGRGGGLADASFHANLGQVMSWAQLLAAEAEKKAKKDESHVLSAVGAVVQVTIQCLERNPESRLKSDALEKRLGELIKKFANIDPLHCVFAAVEQPKQPAPTSATPEPSLVSSTSTSVRANRSRSRPRQESIPEDAELESRPSTTISSGIRPATSRYFIPTAYTPAVSIGSLPSLSLDTDNHSEQSERSATVVGSFTPSRDHSIRTYRREQGWEARDRAIQAWAATDFSPEKRRQFDYLQRNDSDTDPHLRLSTDNSEEGVFTYMSYSTSTSEDEEPSNFMYPLPPPPKRPPTRDLPPVPPKSQTSLSKSQAQAALPVRSGQIHSHIPSNSSGPTRHDNQMPQKLPKAVSEKRPPVRMSSLEPLKRDEKSVEDLDPPRLMQVQRPSSSHKMHSDRQKDRMYRARAWNPM